MENKPYIYIYADNYEQYRNFIPQYELTHNCLYITDQYFLQSRTPGEIIDISDTGERWDHQFIQDHIERYKLEPTWIKLNQSKETINEIKYGIDK